MNRNKLLPLTETTFYILLSLKEPLHGYAIMQNVETLSNHHVRIAAGTMYGAIENLSKQKLIQEVPSEDKRRRVYVLTELGKEILEQEVQRLTHMVTVAKKTMIGEAHEKI
ncbi:PadR family transcriptional regulator [Enterococcus sp. JM4C]|uniref:PadR family transcriptional regulator n=1 Tax=Candidatus Enterococcus huntleyi TaxID=1857217 RepID=UPI00137ACBB4|nr:helix-turn-helix transcriptional regulator [Enterococcus sp. JM4C]KAF1296208.1 PadR family transcriptional regulator [Enterococcus sp. JM4C]